MQRLKTTHPIKTKTSDKNCYIEIKGIEYIFQNTGLYLNFLQDEWFNENGVFEFKIKDGIVISYALI